MSTPSDRAIEQLKQLRNTSRRATHEINNLLTMIRMNADFLESDMVRSGASTAELREIQSATERMRLVTAKLTGACESGKGDLRQLAPATGSSTRTLHETVLLVEDDRNLRGLARRILSGHGYRVLEAGDGAEALRVAKEQNADIDLVLTDIELPMLNGPTLADELRRSNPDIRVLFMSAYSEFELVQRGFSKVTDAFLKKPFTGTELVTAVRDIIAGGTPQVV